MVTPWRFDESRLAVVDVTGGTDDNVSHARRFHRSVADCEGRQR
jgi:hypothetical protein